MNNKIATILLLGLITLVTAQDKPSYAIDHASKLLQDLVSDSGADHKNQLEYWKTTEPLLLKNIEKVEKQYEELKTQCDTYKGQKDKTEDEIDKTEHYIEWITKKIADNKENVENLENERCQAMQLYIEDIKNQKLTLKLIVYLKKAINEKEGMSLAEKSKMTQDIAQFIELYKNGRTQELLELSEDYVDDKKYDVDADTSVQSRTEEEIGDEHKDIDREKIKLKEYEGRDSKDWAYWKAEIIKLLEKLENDINKRIEESQEDEVDAGIALVDYKIKIEKENKELEKFLEVEKKKQEDQAKKLGKQTTETNKCFAELETVTDSVSNSKEEYEEKKKQHEGNVKSVTEEIELFKYVEELYRKEVGSQGEVVKERVEDYVVDKKFDDAEYGKREVDEFKNIA